MTHICKHCGSTEFYSDGYTPARKDGTKGKRLKCKECRKAFVVNHAEPITNDESTKPESAPVETFADFERDVRKTTTYLITAAQNATQVNEDFWAALHMYAEYLGDCEVVVIPYRYKNPTSVWTGHQDHNEFWYPELKPYLLSRRTALTTTLDVLADIRVQPTAVKPLTGLEGFSGERSCIVGHPRLQLRTVATRQGQMPKIMTTTGCVTLPNYTDSKAGKKGEHHHTFGAALVEIDADGDFHIRQINWDGECFFDLDRKVTTAGVTEGHSVEAIVNGDLHAQFYAPEVGRATYLDHDSMAEVLNPWNLVFHDVLDFNSRNHHNKKDPFIQLANRKGNRDNVRAEVYGSFELVDELTVEFPAAMKVFVGSNHNDALGRWIRESDWREDPINAEFYLETALAMAKATRATDSGYETLNAYSHHGKKYFGDDKYYKFLGCDESFVIEGIELGMHGHLGPNGARGSIGNLSKIGVKSVIGHSHSPGIEGGCYQTGTSSYLKLGYTHGPSSWLQTHCVIYPNGKRTLINIINGKWRA